MVRTSLFLVLTLLAFTPAEAQQSRRNVPPAKTVATPPAPTAPAQTPAAAPVATPPAEEPPAVAPEVQKLLDQPVQPITSEAPAIVPQVKVQTPIKNGCYLVFCQDDPKQCLMFESDGTWMKAAKEVNVTFNFPNEPTVKYLAWDGPFRPTTPREENRQLQGMKTVTADAFQTMVDELNEGKQANLN